MKALLFFLFCYLTVVCVNAQDFQGETSRIVDSLCEHTLLCTGNTKEQIEVAYQRIYDSVELVVVSSHLEKKLSRGGYSWPGWYFEQRRSWYGDSSVNYPSATGWYLLEHNYQISGEGISNGCVVQSALIVYDSLMMQAIRKKWGDDFFYRYAAEAKKMDDHKRGLQLPSLRQGKTTERLYQKFLYADTAKPNDGYKSPLYLIIEFRGGKVAKAYWGENFLGAVQFSVKRFNPEEKLVEKIRALHWRGPMFDRNPADATVIFDFEKRELKFW